MCQGSGTGELNWTYGFQGTLQKVRTDSSEGPLSAPVGCLFWRSKASDMGKVEKCPHPKEPLSGTPTTEIRGREMIVLCVLKTALCLFEADLKDKGGNQDSNHLLDQRCNLSAVMLARRRKITLVRCHFASRANLIANRWFDVDPTPVALQAMHMPT